MGDELVDHGFRLAPFSAPGVELAVGIGAGAPLTEGIVAFRVGGFSPVELGDGLPARLDGKPPFQDRDLQTRPDRVESAK